MLFEHPAADYLSKNFPGTTVLNRSPLVLIYRSSAPELMDHLPQPPRLGRIPRRVPLLCGIDDYDRGDFASFPERKGWKLEEKGLSSLILVRMDGTNGTDSEARR